jgi:hypothetical protein
LQLCSSNTQHPHEVSGCTDEYYSEDPKKGFKQKLPIEHDSRIMGLRVCEGVLSCCPVLVMWCSVSHDTV